MYMYEYVYFCAHACMCMYIFHCMIFFIFHLRPRPLLPDAPSIHALFSPDTVSYMYMYMHVNVYMTLYVYIMLTFVCQGCILGGGGGHCGIPCSYINFENTPKNSCMHVHVQCCVCTLLHGFPNLTFQRSDPFLTASPAR